MLLKSQKGKLFWGYLCSSGLCANTEAGLITAKEISIALCP